MYLNLIQIAESFGVAESVVHGWIREESLPHTHLDLLGRLSRALTGPLRELVIRRAADEEIFRAVEVLEASSPPSSKPEVTL